MTDSDEQLEAQLRARQLPGLSDEARDRLLADLASVTTDEADTPTASHGAPPSLDNRRWIMRHPVSSAAAAAIFVITIVGVGLSFFGGGTTPALADYLQPLLEAKTVKYKMIQEMTSLPAGQGALSAEEQEELMEPRTTEVMESGPNRRRMEWDEWNGRKAGGRRVQIWDGNQRKQLMLFPAAKEALLYDYTDEPEDKTVGKEDQGSASPQHPPKQPRTVALFRSLLRDTVQKPGAQRDSLGEKEIDGRRVVGFRLCVRGVTIDVWGDPKTRLPVRIESTIALVPHLKITESNFEFNVPMDESLFSLEPPAGYEVIVKDSQPRDDSPKTEKDLIDLFRYYGRWSGGRFPDVLDWQWIDEVQSEARSLDAELTHRPQAEREQQFEEGSKKLQRAMGFMLQLTKDSDWHYGGKGVSIDAADTPIFWYRPKDATKYRVIYADLSVQETGTPPPVPVVPATQMEKDLIEMFRQHAESKGDRFPDTLRFPKFVRRCLQYPPTLELGEEQQQELLEARVKLQRGAIFIGLLPKDADWHYAGKYVRLGMPDRPIFWYRPNNSETYRVVYADLSVRDADTPPSMPAALPEPGRPQGDCTIAVKVVDEATGKPVPDAHVYLFYPPTSHSTGVTTDRDGSHIFKNVDTGPYSLRTGSTAGYQDAFYDPDHKGLPWTSFSLKEGEQRRDIVLKLKQACRISGKVVDENGNLPEDAAQLIVYAWFKADRREGYENKGMGLNPSNGSYVIDGLSEKPAYVTVENRRAAKEGDGPPPIYYPSTFSRSEAKLISFENGRSVENVNITRRKEGGLVIAGTVRDEAGKPVPDAFVVVHPRDMYGGLVTAYTNPQGHYQIQGLGEGEYQVHVDAIHRGLVRTRMPIRLGETAKKTELNFTLQRGATISGKLVDENGLDWKDTGILARAIVSTGERSGFLPNVDLRNKYQPKNSDGMARGWLYLGKGAYPDGQMIFPTESTFIVQGMMPGHTTFQFESLQKIAKILHAGQDILDSGIDTEPGQEIKDVTIVIGKP